MTKDIQTEALLHTLTKVIDTAEALINLHDFKDDFKTSFTVIEYGYSIEIRIKRE